MEAGKDTGSFHVSGAGKCGRKREAGGRRGLTKEALSEMKVQASIPESAPRKGGAAERLCPIPGPQDLQPREAEGICCETRQGKRSPCLRGFVDQL